MIVYLFYGCLNCNIFFITIIIIYTIISNIDYYFYLFFNYYLSLLSSEHAP